MTKDQIIAKLQETKELDRLWTYREGTHGHYIDIYYDVIKYSHCIDLSTGELLTRDDPRVFKGWVVHERECEDEIIFEDSNDVEEVAALLLPHFPSMEDKMTELCRASKVVSLEGYQKLLPKPQKMDFSFLDDLIN